MGLAGALYVSFIGFVSRSTSCRCHLPGLGHAHRGGSGNNRGALLGALVVWAIWRLRRGSQQAGAADRARRAPRSRSS